MTVLAELPDSMKSSSLSRFVEAAVPRSGWIDTCGKFSCGGGTTALPREVD